MPTLSVAAHVAGLGVIAWLFGALFDPDGIGIATSFIGGTLVLGVGAMITTDGLRYRVGETQDMTLTTVNNTTVANATDVSFQYAQLDAPTFLPLGALIMIFGVVLILAALNRRT